MESTMQDAQHQKVDANIAEIIAETVKINAETAKINAEARFYPLIIAGGVLATAGTIIKLFS